MGGESLEGMRMGQDTENIVKFLLDRGITGMKIYPFNEFSFMEREPMQEVNLSLRKILIKV